MNVAEWTSISRNGRDSTTNALKELIAAGYVEKIQNREDGQFSYSEVILHLIK